MRKLQKNLLSASAGVHPRLIFVLLLLPFMVGCPRKPELPPLPPPPTKAEALARYNDNISRVVPFRYAIFTWEAKFPDKKHEDKYVTVTDRGDSLFFAPADPNDPNSRAQMLLWARVIMGESQALIVGSNQTEFWMYSRVADRGWWGRYENLGKPCMQPFPLGDPQVLLDHFGLRSIPVAQIGMENIEFAVHKKQYLLAYPTRLPRGEVLRRELYFDQRTGELAEAITREASGRVLMRSTLGKYQQLGAARIPGNIRLESPEGSYLSLELWKLRAWKLDASKFVRPEEIPGIPPADYVQLDGVCE